MSELSRNGNFSSSEIHKLTKSGRGKSDYFGAPALTYIEEKKMERRLGRPLSTDHDAQPTTWGKLVESIAFERMGLEYQLVSKKRYVHPEIKCWVGMPDVVTDHLSGDIKSPWTMKSFCQMVDAMQEGYEALKEVKPEYAWQLVSNCILTGKKEAGFFVYVPYRDELKEIREAAAMTDEATWINYKDDSYLPYLIEGGYYKNINELIFEVPQSDIDFLTERVLEAEKLLIK